MRNLSKSLMLIAILVGYLQSLSAQDTRQLISSTTKTFKVHWGIEGGISANYLFTDLIQDNYITEENSALYRISLAPRPEAQFGMFSEIEFKRWSMRLFVGYMGKTVPKPYDVLQGEEARYNLAYVNNFVHNFMFYYLPTGRTRIGLGWEHHMAYMGKKRMDGDLEGYWSSLNTMGGLRAEFGYQLNPRTHVNTFVVAGRYNGFNSKVVDNVSAGVTVSYRLKGKEYEIKKDIYKLNYETMEMPEKPQSIGH